MKKKSTGILVADLIRRYEELDKVSTFSTDEGFPEELVGIVRRKAILHAVMCIIQEGSVNN